MPMCNDDQCRKPTKTAILVPLCQAPLELAVRGAIEIPAGGGDCIWSVCSKEIGKRERSTCLMTFLYFSPFRAIMFLDEHDFVLYFVVFCGGGALDVARYHKANLEFDI